MPFCIIQTLAEVLKVNSTLMILNLESNRITRKGIKVRKIVGAGECGGGRECVGVGLCVGGLFMDTFVGLFV